ncbi:MAG: hypothetical protein ACRCXZ_01755 [Patescibacteria group bacterium]
MKIAVLGKGGSGKSTVSWLLSKYFSSIKKVKTLAIDGDHNMDLSTNLGFEIQNPNYFKDFGSEFRKLANMPTKGMWKEYFNNKVVNFSYPEDSFINDYTYKIDSNLDLVIVGLGSDEVMENIACSHGLSAPVKYMMPTLDIKDDVVVIYDSVAGVDMLNYGLYFGFDVLLIIVEGHRNSIKVAEQIMHFAKIQGLNFQFIVNKFDIENQLLSDFVIKYKENIVEFLEYDKGMRDYKFDEVEEKSIRKLDKINQELKKFKSILPFEKLKSFELSKK